MSTARASAKRIQLSERSALDLVDANTGMAPVGVQVKRKGLALHIGVNGNSPDTPDFVVENFFNTRTAL